MTVVTNDLPELPGNPAWAVVPEPVGPSVPWDLPPSPAPAGWVLLGSSLPDVGIC